MTVHTQLLDIKLQGGPKVNLLPTFILNHGLLCDTADLYLHIWIHLAYHVRVSLQVCLHHFYYDLCLFFLSVSILIICLVFSFIADIITILILITAIVHLNDLILDLHLLHLLTLLLFISSLVVWIQSWLIICWRLFLIWNVFLFTTVSLYYIALCIGYVCDTLLRLDGRFELIISILIVIISSSILLVDLLVTFYRLFILLRRIIC